MKKLETILLFALIILLIAGTYVAVRNIGFFRIEGIDVSVSGPVTNVSADMQRIINPVKGMNIFEVNLASLRKSLEAFDGVKEVKIKRYFPDRLIVEISYNEISLKAFSVDEGKNVNYYFIHEDVLDEVSEATWTEFDKLGVIELNPAYANMISKWGSDSGFASMVVLAEHLSGNNLITSMKYDNNNGNDFGRLVVDLPPLNSTLHIKELVSVQALDEALEYISNHLSAGGAAVVYDLYANALVKRT